jgi:TonB family protein
MKGLFVIASAVFVLAGQALASAYTNSPSISLIPLTPRNVAISNAGPGCNTPAAVDGQAYFEVPDIAAAEHQHGTAGVIIDLDSSGNLAAERVYNSSGSRWLDLAALKSARMTKFVAEKVNCEAVSGEYMYEVEF